MSLKDSMGESAHWARRRLEELRRRYMDALGEAEHLGEERLDELKQLVDRLGPSLRGLVDERMTALQTKLDELNQRLAEEAVPEERKTSVGRLALDKKAASAARKASNTVKRGRGKSQASARPASGTKKSRASGAAKSSK